MVEPSFFSHYIGWKHGKSADNTLTTGWSTRSPAPSVDSFKLASSKMGFCEFKQLLSFHESTKYRLFSLLLIFMLINPQKEPGVVYTSEIRKGNGLHQKKEI